MTFFFLSIFAGHLPNYLSVFFFFLDLHNAFSITFLYILLNVIRFMCISFPFPCGRLHISWNPVMIVLLSACEPASQKIILPSKLVSTIFVQRDQNCCNFNSTFPFFLYFKKKKKKKV